VPHVNSLVKILICHNLFYLFQITSSSSAFFTHRKRERERDIVRESRVKKSKIVFKYMKIPTAKLSRNPFSATPFYVSNGMAARQKVRERERKVIA
jgi:hypothetical protein